MRYFIKFAFKGSLYHGWQIQPNGTTVQSVLDEALSRLLRCEIRSTGCGRTDAGVHALQFYAHFDVDDPMDFIYRENLASRLNRYLPMDIKIEGIHAVSEGAHARFSAISRTYEYHIIYKKDPFRHEFAWFYPYTTLDLPKMQAGSDILLGYSDFASFSKKDTDINGTESRLSRACWETEGEGLVFIITANRFLRNMVRAIAGTLVEMGKGKLDEEGLIKIIESGNRCRAGESVPACGLFLTEVIYPEEIFLD